MACSSDSTINDIEEAQGQVPMQFSQAALNAPSVTRAFTRGTTLEQGFLVSCYKNSNTNSPRLVMDKYEVQYYAGGWDNSQTRWDYVGTKEKGFYKNQVQRYWDVSSFPYRFYAISPCPAHDVISDFTLSNQQLVIPESVTFTYQTCNKGALTVVSEPYSVAQVQCASISNSSDVDLLNNSSEISKNSSLLSRYVALPFHHLLSKVRFAIYSTNGVTFAISNVEIKAQQTDGFITSANGYKADLSEKNMLEGQFTKTTKEQSTCTLLTNDGTSSLASFDKTNPYWFQCKDGMLQIPQQGVRLSISFKINDTPYSDIPIAIKNGENTTDSFTWESNKIYTYLINISDLKPLTIEFSAVLVPWTEVSGSITTDLEQ